VFQAAADDPDGAWNKLVTVAAQNCAAAKASMPANHTS